MYTLLFNTRALLPNFPEILPPGQTQISITFPTLTPTTNPKPTLQSTPEPTLEPEILAPAVDRCQPFDQDQVSLVLLGLRPDTLHLPLYIKISGGVPGLSLESTESDPNQYRAFLGSYESYQCGLQGFEDRLYCMFELPESTAGQGLDLSVFRDSCPNPVYSQSMVSIPEPIQSEIPVCSKDLDPDDCAAVGGEMSSGHAAAPHCICP